MLDKFKDKINPNVGSITFWISNHNLFDASSSVITIDRFTVGDTEFVLQREPDMTLVFQHNNPKTGTRISKLDLNQVGNASRHFIGFTWGENEVNLYMGTGEKDNLIHGKFQKLT